MEDSDKCRSLSDSSKCTYVSFYLNKSNRTHISWAVLPVPSPCSVARRCFLWKSEALKWEAIYSTSTVGCLNPSLLHSFQGFPEHISLRQAAGFRDCPRSNPLCSGPMSELKAGQLREHEVERECIAGINVIMSDFCGSFYGDRESSC